MSASPFRRAGSRIACGRVAAACASLVLVGVGSSLLATASHAAFTDLPVTGMPGRLVLAADAPRLEVAALSPGDSEYLQVEARLEDADRAALSVELRKAGALVEHPRGLRMTLQWCEARWAGLPAQPSCATGARLVAAATPDHEYETVSPVFELPALAATAPVHLLVELALEDSAAARADSTLHGLNADVAVGMTAVSIDGIPTEGSSGALPATGGGLATLGATLALAAGLTLAGVAARRARPEETS